MTSSIENQVPISSTLPVRLIDDMEVILESLPKRGNGEKMRFFMELQSLEGKDDGEKIEASYMVQPLLQQHREAFHLVQGLPPLREHEHVIILKEVVSPINVHSYRYSQIQMDEIERLIREMLEFILQDLWPRGLGYISLSHVVQKTAATFAPRASTASKNPAVPGTALYTIFEVQGYASMLIGGALSFNLIFPSNEPDIWRLMGMWSIWMFTIPSLRARDCSKNEKEALNYLFLLIPLLNVLIPFFWKSFAVVWSADTIAFFVLYAWKMGWLQRTE
ncbi:hypothetical protein KFK09_015349 [Dendrobium nobile]|uniref:Uncharacterized protein n=1 Tax=Dendrobium nobile TaxID=94219 RepID=A0A8T3B489_DENNO|nr:hypothetical protein KFK09_015349 [Dendrobium nobile]